MVPDTGFETDASDAKSDQDAHPTNESFVLQSMRCFACEIRLREEQERMMTPTDVMLPLPSDTIDIPLTLLSISDAYNNGYEVKLCLIDRKPVVFIPGPSIISNNRTRQDNLKGLHHYRGDFYMLDDALINRLGSKQGPRSELKIARPRVMVFKDTVEKLSSKLVDEYYRQRTPQLEIRDTRLLDVEIKRLVAKRFEIGGHDAGGKLIQSLALTHGVSLSFQASISRSKAMDVNFEKVMDAAQAAYGMVGEEAVEFHCDVANNDNVRPHLRLVPSRPKSFPKIVFVLPNGMPWDQYVVKKDSSSTHMSSLRRWVFVLKMFCSKIF